MKKAAAIAIILLLSLVFYSFSISYHLRQQAQEIAGEQPYCVQVTKSAGYGPVASFMDTMGLLMQGRDNYHHAVLVVGSLTNPDTYHWSYFAKKFIRETNGPQPIVCVPTRDYFKHPTFFNSQKNEIFALQGRILGIPKVFHPEPAWASMVGYGYFATAPSFAPANALFTGRLSNVVLVAFSGGATPSGMSSRNKADYQIDELGRAYGLQARRFTSLRNGSHIYYDYMQTAKGGHVTTYITCFDSQEFQCLHIFSEGGLTYSFSHMPADLPQWRAMQERLIALHKTFELQEKDVPQYITGINTE